MRNASQNHEIFFYGGSTTRRSFALDVDGTDFFGNVLLQFFSFGDDFNGIVTGVPLNQWMHIAVTYDGIGIRVYVNGLLKERSTFLPGAPLDTDTSGNFFFIGHFNGYFDGLIDEVEVFNRAIAQFPPAHRRAWQLDR